MEKIAGTYRYVNKNTGALYVGSADDIWRRHQRHLNPLPVDIAIANEGIENFDFEILAEFPFGTDRNILRQNERKWIDYYDAENNSLHYNQGFSLWKQKYTLWNPQKVYYKKDTMFQGGNEQGLKPRRCFQVNSPKVNTGHTYRLPIGLFNEPISPTIIYDFCQKWS